MTPSQPTTTLQNPRSPAMPSSASGYRVVPADLQRDRQVILDVWRRNLATYFTPGQESLKFNWYYQENPHGPGRCWLLLKTPGDDVVGTCGLGVRRVSIAGTSRLVGLASDFAVDKEHRTLLPALMLQRAMLACLQDDLAFIYGLPNAKAATVLQRVGYECPGYVVRYAKILNVERYLHSVLRLRFAARGLAAVLNPAVRLASADTRLPGIHSFHELPAFDDRFDDLWTRSASMHPLIGQRTRDFLRWRFAQCPLLQYRTLAILDQHADRLLGYAVCFNTNPHELAIADILTDPQAGALDELLAQVISFARTQRYHVIHCRLFGAPHLQKSLARMGFRLRQAETPLLIFPMREKVSPLSPDQIQQWHFVPSDEDCN